MSMAPPGTSTGRFHIILGYIPRKRTWQELKDFVHQAGFQVAHVQIHAGLHSGWICVDGEDNFWRLGDWLKQAEWDGNRFQVDMRNYDQETPLGPSSYIPLESPRSARSSYSVASIAPTTSSMNENSQFAYSFKPIMQIATTQAYSCGTSALGYSVTSPQQYSFGGPVSPTYTTSFVQPLMYGRGGIQQLNATPTYQYAYAPYPTTTSAIASPSFSQPAGPPSPPTTIRLENRRLYLTRTSGASSEKEIRKRVLAACHAPTTNPIETIEIPTHADGRQRGHALILLQTEEQARLVRERLDGMSVKGSDGRKYALKVKFAQEGAPERADELAVKMAGLGMGCQGAVEQDLGSPQGVGANGKGIIETGEMSPPEETAYERERRRSSLPIANGSSLVLPGAVGLSSSAVVKNRSEYRESSRKNEVKRGEGKHSHKDRDRGQERKHHVASSAKVTEVIN
ncbi:hypothetical protein VC83_07304 [Pseudogymnoascus destructans]|uniref:RRM domain-containing protein n=1 Tax=Pseudogymnoascus destructans TaxID=655981 RepID=A0A177A4Q0_9PEZI|nr:uncharacterized protein VC83_07304 [Pseudogymnoascus destructans]OAF56600.1 hypothetical protein VC83_07304 [Pseudogymnoascus destructans]